MDTAHTARMGDLMQTCSPLATKFCICVTSFVERVTRLAMENLFRSWAANPCTLSNCTSRIFLPRDAAKLAIMNPVDRDRARLAKAQMTISIPYWMTVSWSSSRYASVILLMYSGMARSKNTWQMIRNIPRVTRAHSRRPIYFPIIPNHQPISGTIISE